MEVKVKSYALLPVAAPAKQAGTRASPAVRKKRRSTTDLLKST
jgi:hypothetical protein